MVDSHHIHAAVDGLSSMTSSQVEYEDRCDSEVDTSSSCSYEETAAKIEQALRRGLRLDVVDSSSIDNCYDQNGSSLLTGDQLCIDVKTVPGYQEIPPNCPAWKRTLIEKKNTQLEEYAMQEFLAKKQEEDRWRNVPEWKKALILEKEKRKNEEMLAMRMEDHEVLCLSSLPEWKRNLVMKKRTSTDSS